MSSLPGEALSLGLGRGIGVVRDKHGNTGRVGHEIAQRHVGPPEVGGRANGAVPVHEAGVPIPMPSTGIRGAGDRGTDELDDHGGVDTTALRGPRPRAARHYTTGDVEYRRPERRAGTDRSTASVSSRAWSRSTRACLPAPAWTLVRRREPDPCR